MARFRGVGSLILVLGCVVPLACTTDDDASDVQTPVEPSFQSGLPYEEPDELVSRDGALTGKLVSSPTELDVSGAKVSGEAFNGTFIGPTLKLEPGDSIEIGLQNALAQHTNIHFHGFHVDPGGQSDNIFRMVLPGETADYLVKVPEDHEQGVFWYHSHMHTMAESQVFQGLSGMILIGDTRRLLPERFRDVERRMLALKDLQVENGAILAANIDSDAPTVRTVNGLVDPVLGVRPGSTEIWDIANIGADIFYDVALEGATLRVIGEDGSPVFQNFEATHLVMPPGKRWEVLVTFPDADELEFKTLAYDQGGDQYPETRLMQVKVEGEVGAAVAPLTDDENPAVETDLLERPVAAKRTWTFTEDDETSEFFINGKEFDTDRVDVSPKLGTVEEWTLRNSTTEQHPFHIHVNDFRVLSIGGEPYEAHGLQDTVILPPGKDVVVRIPFDDFTGKFVFHCHILNHEDNGMMAVVDVVE